MPLEQVEVVAAVQPLAPTAQVCRLVLDRQVVPVVHAFVQHDAASTDGLEQVPPTEVHTGSTLHVHLAIPAAPVQVWRGPQVTAALHCPPVQVCRPVASAEHWVAPSLHAAVFLPVLSP